MPDSQFSKAELPDFPPGLVAEASKGSLLPSGKVTLSMFCAYEDTGYLYGHDNLFSNRKDSRLHKLSEEFPELRSYIEELLSHPPTFSFQQSPAERMREGLVTKGLDDDSIAKLSKWFQDFGLVEPYMHQQNEIFGDQKSKGFLTFTGELEQFPEQQAAMAAYKKECENVVLDKFHKQYPGLAFRYVKSKTPEYWVSKILALQKLAAPSGYSAFAAASGSLSFRFATEPELNEFKSACSISDQDLTYMRMPQFSIEWPSLEILAQSELPLLWEKEARIAKTNKGTWLVDSDEYYSIDLPYFSVVLLKQLEPALFPFLLKTSSNPMAVFDVIISLSEKHPFSLVQADRERISLLSQDTKESTQKLLNDIKKIFPQWRLEVTPCTLNDTDHFSLLTLNSPDR